MGTDETTVTKLLFTRKVWRP